MINFFYLLVFKYSGIRHLYTFYNIDFLHFLLILYISYYIFFKVRLFAISSSFLLINQQIYTIFLIIYI